MTGGTAPEDMVDDASMRGAVVGFLLFSVLLPLTARAYRPFDSTDADVAETHAFEIEFEPIGYYVSGKSPSLMLPQLTLNYGFLPGWEVVLEGNHQRALGGEQPASQITDTGLYVKHVLRPGVLQDKTGISLATEVGILLPTYPDMLPGVGGWAALIASYRWPAIALHLNAAFEWTRNNHPGGVGGLIIEGPDAWVVRPVAELLGEKAGGGVFTATGLVGAIWRVSETLSFDAAGRYGATDAGPLEEVRLGLTWVIPIGGATK